MEAITGIKYTKDSKGNKRYVRIDLDMYGENQLLEDFLDMIEIKSRQGESTFPFEEVMKAEFERRGLKYDVSSSIQ